MFQSPPTRFRHAFLSGASKRQQTLHSKLFTCRLGSCESAPCVSVPVSRSVMFFQLWWVLKLQSQNFLENWQLLMWIEHPKGFPKSEMRTCRKTHLGKTWFNPMGNPQFFTFKDLKFGTTSHSTVMGKAFSSCWQALALPWSWSVWHPGTMLCA